MTLHQRNDHSIIREKAVRDSEARGGAKQCFIYRQDGHWYDAEMLHRLWILDQPGDHFRMLSEVTDNAGAIARQAARLRLSLLCEVYRSERER